jgi:alginate O-acetyltransferase complex protein AlgI
MNVPSLTFFLFAAVVATAHQLCPLAQGRRLIFLAANLYFLSTYAHGLAAFLPLAVFLAVGYGAVQAVRRGASPVVFTASLALVFFSFIWLKRYTFLPAASFLPFAYVTLGLSYIFFRVMHLIIDARDANLPPTPLVSYLNYTLNFTTLVSGPIQRYQDFIQMESEKRPKLTFILAGQALERIVIGSFKVLIVSALLKTEHLRALQALPVDTIASERMIDGLSIALVYPVYLYFNFSGYIDIVIGVAKFIGLELPENFNRPFSSENFISFWSRWHITLSNWLKTYVYSPLLITLMRRFPDRRLEPYFGVFAFFVTFFLVGLWHGQTSVFLFFGLLQGLGVSANKLYQIQMASWLGRKPYKELCDNALYRAASRGLTFCWFAFTLFWFWSDWHQISQIAGALGTPMLVLTSVTAFVGMTLILAIGEGVRSAILAVRLHDTPLVTSRYVRTVWETALAVVTVATVELLNAPAPDIVYKAF